MTSLMTTLVIADPTVKDYQSLVNHTRSEVEVFVLDATQNGIEQITRLLADRHELDALHILSHGEPGALQLGNTQLSLATLERYVGQIQSWAKAMAGNATVLLYGCKVAAGTIGQNFVHQLSGLLGTPIAASTNLTGNAALGGDWTLEFATGEIQAPLAFQPEVMAAYPHVLQIVYLTETFANADVSDKNWLFGVEALDRPDMLNPFLTARTEVDAPPRGLPGNPAVGPYPPVDPVGSGVLRMTNALEDQATYVLYDRPFSSKAGLQIVFDYFAYGGTGADGLSFFLIDGSARPQTAGGFGGSLGYASRTGIEGIEGGYLGIGFDEYGNYSNPTEGRVGGIGFIPDAIAIRGSESNNYRYLTGTQTLPFSLDEPSVTVANREAARRRVQIVLTPGGLLSVQIDANQDNDFDDPGETPPELQNFDIRVANGEGLPDTFTFGFASGTGDQTNIHEVRNIVLTPLSNPPETVDAENVIPPGTIVNLTGLAAVDPDPGDFVTSFTILTVPPPEQGTLFLGNPGAGGTPVTAGQVIPPDQIGQLFFQPTPAFTGSIFTYTATDSMGAQDPTPATVSLVFPPAPENVLPETANAANTIPPQTTVNLTGLAGTDPDGVVIAYTILSVPPVEEGSLYLGNPDEGGILLEAGQEIRPEQIGQLFFQPTATFTGSAFTYTAIDNLGAADPTPAIVSLLLPGQTNIPPDTASPTNQVPPGATVNLTGLSGVDPDGVVTSFVITSLPPAEEGALFLGDPNAGGAPVTEGQVLTPDQINQLFFTPTPAFSGTTVTYAAVDNLGAIDDTPGTVNLVPSTAPPPPPPQDNLPPTAGNFTIPVSPGINAPLPDFPVSDPDGNVAAITISTLPPATDGQLFVGDPAQGGRPVTAGEVLTPDQADQLIFQPGPGFDGGSFTYFATDDDGAVSTPATVTLSPAGDNLPPIAQNEEAALNPDDIERLPGLPVTDPDGTVTSITIVDVPPADQGQLFLGDPSFGGRPVTEGEQLTPAEVNQLFFQASPGFTGSDIQFFGTDDAGATSNIATLTLQSLRGVEPIGPDRNCRTGARRRGDQDSRNSLRGTPDRDTLIGGAEADVLRGLGCPDLIDGQAGNDRTRGGGAGDMIMARRGSDRAFGNRGDDFINVGLGSDRANAGRGNDLVTGRRGDDRIIAKYGNDIAAGNRGEDTIRGGANHDLLYGRQQADVIRGENGMDLIFGNIGRDRLFGGQKEDTIYAGAGKDRAKGQSSADIVFGQGGDDRILGGAQNDRLIGNRKNDTIVGGGGADTMSGAAGLDRFIFRNITHGGDVITDFGPKETLDFSNIFSGEEYSRTGTFAYIKRIQAGNDTVIRLDANGDDPGGFVNYLRLLNVDASNLSARNFIV